eukprot:TRINITY_DN1074_c0_g1_i1.p1 TRINITY_DN1074_c0_g1~~TRINITY_DN1074_c0_g1_i1.p1  ORF type:complete len:547 (+),score=123.13 TRINITY_DN1074_c0_g1_i1:627-2267(+)
MRDVYQLLNDYFKPNETRSVHKMIKVSKCIINSPTLCLMRRCSTFATFSITSSHSHSFQLLNTSPFSSTHSISKRNYATHRTHHEPLFTKLAEKFVSLKCISYETLLSMKEERERREKEEWEKNKANPIQVVIGDEVNENANTTTQNSQATQPQFTEVLNEQNVEYIANNYTQNSETTPPHTKTKSRNQRRKKGQSNTQHTQTVNNNNNESMEYNPEDFNPENPQKRVNNQFQSTPSEEEIKGNLPPGLEFPTMNDSTQTQQNEPITFQHVYKLLNCDDTLSTPNGGTTTVKEISSLVIQLQKAIVNHDGWMVNADFSQGVQLFPYRDKTILLAFSNKSLFEKYGYVQDKESEMAITTTGRDLLCSLIPHIQEKHGEKFMGVILDNWSGHAVSALDQNLMDLSKIGNALLVEEILQKFWKTNKWEDTFELQNVMCFPFHILKQRQDPKDEESTLTIISENQQPPAYLIGFTSFDRVLEFIQHSVNKELYDTMQINGEDIYQILKQSGGELEGIVINPPDNHLKKNRKGVYNDTLRLKDFINENDQS